MQRWKNEGRVAHPWACRDAGGRGLRPRQSIANYQSLTPTPDKRNPNRFPPDFMFPLSRQEFAALISQNATSKGRGGRRKPPNVFTEHGALMAANVLNSGRAIEVSGYVVRAFVRLRAGQETARKSMIPWTRISVPRFPISPLPRFPFPSVLLCLSSLGSGLALRPRRSAPGSRCPPRRVSLSSLLGFPGSSGLPRRRRKVTKVATSPPRPLPFSGCRHTFGGSDRRNRSRHSAGVTTATRPAAFFG